MAFLLRHFHNTLDRISFLSCPIFFAMIHLFLPPLRLKVPYHWPEWFIITYLIEYMTVDIFLLELWAIGVQVLIPPSLLWDALNLDMNSTGPLYTTMKLKITVIWLLSWWIWHMPPSQNLCTGLTQFIRFTSSTICCCSHVCRHRSNMFMLLHDHQNNLIAPENQIMIESVWAPGHKWKNGSAENNIFRLTPNIYVHLCTFLR